MHFEPISIVWLNQLSAEKRASLIHSLFRLARESTDRMEVAYQNPSAPESEARWRAVGNIQGYLDELNHPTAIQEYMRQHEQFFIAVQGKRVIGFTHIEPKTRKTLYSRITFVHPDYWGKQIGKKLQYSVFGFARKHGYTRLQGDLTSEGSHALYQQMAAKPRSFFKKGQRLERSTESIHITPAGFGISRLHVKINPPLLPKRPLTRRKKK
ncbi:MAG: GNAT family N-acetyltransferase [Candidatus Iainarchaeum archaeon]|uniref:GNAT family N-acetyltransferase n=1 Tax=Candidatus Iainarchaeum sp. TaxID=3101447 RepID=A0A7T9I1D5_9ARCH|nr:MAG: GNAT family N-acetyltransferase [Candidatus Diapherotrites archaeon]